MCRIVQIAATRVCHIRRKMCRTRGKKKRNKKKERTAKRESFREKEDNQERAVHEEENRKERVKCRRL